MASSRKAKRKELERTEPTKEEYAVAKFLRFKVPVREGNLQGIEVSCFYADDAVNALLDSKWSKGKDCLFTDRKSCVEYCGRLLRLGLFTRAKLAKKPEKLKSASSSSKSLAAAGTESRDSGTESSRKGKNASSARGGDSGAEGARESLKKRKKAATPNSDEKGESGKSSDNKKKLKKLKVEVHDELPFVDGREVCVWIYDPTSFKTFAGGLLLIFGAIAFCLYPLWPQEMRGVIYYVSMAAIGLLIVLLIVSALRHILFLCVWAMTGGSWYLWVLPNLWQDCGFFESFKPFYSIEKASNSTDSGVDGTSSRAQSQDPAQVEDDPAGSDAELVISAEESQLQKNAAGDNVLNCSSCAEENGDFEIVDAPVLSDEVESDAQ